jgi:hypothetical protein
MTALQVACSAIAVVFITFLVLYYLKNEVEDDADINIDDMI